jgi:hypothetical protein
MIKFTEKYKDFMTEGLQDTFGDKLSEKYRSLKIGILDLVQKSVKDYEELVNVQNFMNKYTEDPDSVEFVEFVEEGDIYEFYLKFQTSIDELCSDKDYFSKPPKDNNVFSLYDYIIVGTKYAVSECMKEMTSEMF